MIATLGSKEGLANLAQAITAPGDIILVPNPSLPDPRLRLHHGRRRDPPRAGPARRTTSSAGVERAVKHSVPKPTGGDLSYPSNPTAQCSIWTSTARSSRSAEEARASSSCPTSPIPRSTSTTIRRPRSCRSTGAKDIAVEFNSLSQDLRHGRLARRLGGRQRAADRARWRG